MMYKKALAALGLSTFIAGSAFAAVSPEEAARLGKDLTPMGAERAGNEDGSIPAWEPKWKGLPPGLEYEGPGHTRPDPYEADEPIVTITAQNYQEHAEQLGEGQKALFERYPDYRIVVYPTHRDFDVNDTIKARVKWNATNTELDNGVETLNQYNGGVAFPMPDGYAQIMWNMRTNGCMESYHVAYDGYGVFADGVQGLFREPVAIVQFGGLFAGVDFHPGNFLAAVVGFRYRGVDHIDHYRADIDADTVTFDVGDDRIVRDVQAVIFVDGDFVTFRRNLNMLVAHSLLRCC